MHTFDIISLIRISASELLLKLFEQLCHGLNVGCKGVELAIEAILGANEKTQQVTRVHD